MKKPILLAVIAVSVSSCNLASFVTSNCKITSTYQIDSTNVKICGECKNLNQIQFKRITNAK